MIDRKKPERFLWTKTVESTLFRMRIVGIWPSTDHYRKDFYLIWSAVLITIFVLGPNFFQTVNLIYIITDLETLMGSIYIDLSDMICIQKSYLFIKNMKNLKELLQTVNSDLFQPKNERQREMVKINMRFWKVMSFIYWTAITISVGCWAAYPIFDDMEPYKLPFLAWYPFDYKVSPIYEIIYVYQILGVMANACTALTTDTLIAALHMYTASQFDILCDDFRHLHELAEDLSVDFSKKLVERVNHHRAILKFEENTAKFANWIIFGQFFVSALSIGITMFQLSKAALLSVKFFGMIAFVTTLTTEIFILCYFGNEVELKSLQIPYAIFECNWINASEQAKKEMIIMIERCQRPLKISALNLFYLSLETFMKIVRVSWSYFMLLYQLTSGK